MKITEQIKITDNKKTKNFNKIKITELQKGDTIKRRKMENVFFDTKKV